MFSDQGDVIQKSGEFTDGGISSSEVSLFVAFTP